MRNLLTAIILLSLLSGTPAVADNAVVTNGVVASENILDKLIALVKEYTGRVEAATSMEEVEAVYAEFEQAIASFTKENTGEIAKFDARLTDKMKADYAAELAKAIRRFKAALEKKAMEFLGE